MLGIIIPTKDNTTELFACLRSIKKSTSIDYRVYVADTGSSIDIKDATKKVLHTLFGSNSKFIEYDYYNFAKINNDVVKNHLDADIDVLLFCNNDIKIGVVGLIDVIHNTILDNKDKIGTCGCRLVYPDKTIQHDGQVVRLVSKRNNRLIMTHYNLRVPSSTVFRPKATIIEGITFALCGTLRSRFESIGMLSENYIECFEDVQYNMECTNNDYINLLLPSSYWAYHLESLTRGDSLTGPNYRKDYRTICSYIEQEYTKNIKSATILSEKNNV